MKPTILGIAYELPPTVETNADLQRLNPDWRMDDIFAKSGIWSRHVVSENETASDLAFRAADRLLSSFPGAREEIDYVLYCTQSPDYLLPSTACILQSRLGIKRSCGATDFNLGCSGYVYGLQLASALIASGNASKVLLITADTYSRYIHPKDRTVKTLFGDGAAATLLGSEKGVGELGDFLVGTDGAGAMNLLVPSGGHRMPKSESTNVEVVDAAGCVRTKDHLFMDGPAIFTFALSTVPREMARFAKEKGKPVEDFDLFVFHQANKYMLENLARQGKLPLGKVVIDVHDIGNTVSSSIPIALARAVESGRVKQGNRLLLVGFGVGYSWGICDVTWVA